MREKFRPLTRSHWNLRSATLGINPRFTLLAAVLTKLRYPPAKDEGEREKLPGSISFLASD